MAERLTLQAVASDVQTVATEVRRLVKATKLILGTIVVLLLILGVTSIVLLGKTSTNAAQNRASIIAIQQSRLDACNEQTTRNNATIRTLDSEIAQLPPAQQAEARRSRQYTVALIDTLAPPRTRQQCAALVKTP